MQDNLENLQEQEQVKKNFSFFGFLKEITSIILMSLVIVIPVRYYLIQPFVVKGASMEPNFKSGEYLIINEIEYRFSQPQRGDVIVFKYPKDPSEYYIKRIVGLPGEKIEIKGGQVTIYNGQYPQGLSLDEEYLPKGNITRGDVIAQLSKDEYYVLGDNRGSSSDSRIWGTLSRHYIIGKTWIRAFPFDKFTLFKDQS